MKQIEEARQNIDTLIASSKLVRQDHIVLQGNLQLLYDGAKANVESKQACKKEEKKKA